MSKIRRWLWVVPACLAYFPGRYWWEWMGPDGRGLWSGFATAVLLVASIFAMAATLEHFKEGG